MDRNMMLVEGVANAIDLITLNFPGSAIQVTPDGSGGAWFILSPVPLGAPYKNTTIWIGGDLSAQLPYADLYPIFVSLELERLDGSPLGEATSVGVDFHGRKSVQISRRTNRRGKYDNPATKLLKVLAWLKR